MFMLVRKYIFLGVVFPHAHDIGYALSVRIRHGAYA